MSSPGNLSVCCLGVSSDDFTEGTLHDPELLRLSSLVRCVPDRESSNLFPHQFPAVLSVTLADGSEIVERVMTNRGSPNRPLSRDELALKFQVLIDVLNEVRDGTQHGSDANIMRTYEIWKKTGSRRAEKLLRQQGIVPIGSARDRRH